MNPYVLEYLLVQMYPPQEEVHIPVQVVLVVVGQVLAPLLVLVLIIVPAEVVLVVHLHILLLQEDPVRHIIEVVLLLHHVLIRGKALVVTIIVTVLLHLLEVILQPAVAVLVQVAVVIQVAVVRPVQEAVLLPALALSMNTGGRSPRKHWNFLPIVAWRIL